MTTQECTVEVGIGDKKFFNKYQQVVRSSITVDDILTQLQDKDKAQTLINDWFYGMDLRAKAAVRQDILNREAGPEKAFEKNVQDFIKLRAANGKPVTEEKAREMVKMLMNLES
jgi:hypothetical protein